MIVSLTSQTYNTIGGFILPLRPGSNFQDISRRQERTPTLDGSATITDLGFSHADRTFTLVCKVTEQQDKNLTLLISQDYLFVLSCSEGLFYGSIQRKTGIGGNIRITFLVKEKAPDILYPIPLSELPEPRVSGDDGYYYPAYSPFPEKFSTTGTYFSVGKAILDMNPSDVISWHRFPSIDIDPGATVTSANIRFMSDGNYSVPSEYSNVFARVYAVAEDNPDAPLDKNELLAYTWTANYALWTIGTTIIDEYYTTTDLTAVVQEIVNRPGWANGNAIQFLINAPGTLGEGNVRDFKTFDAGVEEEQPLFSYTST